LSANEVKGYLVLLFADWSVRKGEITEEQKSEAQRKILDALKKVWKNRLTKKVIQEALGQDAASKLSKEIDIADQLANIMVTADKIAGNPRLIKRFLNSLYIRQTIAQRQGISIGFEEMIKYQLFERCATQSEFEFLVKDVATSSDGKSKKLSEIEEKIKKGEEYSYEEWNSPFMKQWLELSPRLGEMDMRPLVYLSRDRSTPRVAYDELSPEGQNIFEALCNTNSLVDELYDKIKSVGMEEAEKMLTRFRRDARNKQWDETILIQALNIPKAIPNLANSFIELLNEIPASNRSASFVVFIHEESWAHDLCQKWANDPETPKKVKNAINARKRR
jgi:predicted KAP-like P-loop ATPase